MQIQQKHRMSTSVFGEAHNAFYLACRLPYFFSSRERDELGAHKRLTRTVKDRSLVNRSLGKLTVGKLKAETVRLSKTLQRQLCDKDATAALIKRCLFTIQLGKSGEGA